MTTTEFHHALLQGRGKCIQAVREEPERYREEVLWACRELTSFDTQCEGSKAWFIYELVGCYPDRRPFVEAACDALVHCPSDGDWRIFCLSELLDWFVRDGDQNAWNALLRKYRELFHQMLRVGPPEDCFYWAARDDYEHLCVVLSWCRDHFLEIAHDIGRQSLETEWLRGFEFDWLYAAKGERYHHSLCKAAEKDPCLAEYLRVHEPSPQKPERPSRVRKWLPRRCTDTWRIDDACRAYLDAATDEEKAEALDAFRWFPYPGDPAPLMEDANSDHDGLSKAAWNALRGIRHPSVREFALARLEDEPRAFNVFTTNYQRSDASRLLAQLRAQPVDFECNTWWHAHQGAVLHMAAPPKDALQYIFDTTYCSCCRENALSMMGRRHMLTTELLEECLYDSNSDIRTYARRALNRRKRRNCP